MKAITIWQPWASLIAHGLKKYETRGWATKYRGRIAIHAAKKKPLEAWWWPQDLIEKSITKMGRFSDLPRGGIVAVADLVECFQIGTLEWSDEQKHVGEDEYEVGDLSIGMWAWKLENVVRLPKPIPARGSQGLWNWDVAWASIWTHNQLR